MSVYDPERDEFATVTKIGTGLRDAEWRACGDAIHRDSDRALHGLAGRLALETVERKVTHQCAESLVVLDQTHVLGWRQWHELRCRYLIGDMRTCRGQACRIAVTRHHQYGYMDRAQRLGRVIAQHSQSER